MLPSWLPSHPAPPPIPRPLTTVQTQQVEIIGGSRTHLSPLYRPPRLPAELSTDILVVAAGLLQDQHGSSSHPAILRLAGVDKNTYRAILARVVLPSLDLCCVGQIKALQRALDSSLLPLADIAAHATRRLCITIDNHKSHCRRSATPDTKGRGSRTSLYDHLSRLQEFDKEASLPIRSILSACKHLTHLHLETTPGLLVTKRNAFAVPAAEDRLTPALADALQLVKCNLEELSCLLSPWGGAGLEDLFTNLIKCPKPSSDQPWSRLTHLQIQGPAGFRISLPTSSAIGALPSLTHLGLVMPNIVRDTTMGGDVNSPPAALQLLVLLADKLQRLVFVGHTLEGYLGWNGLYRPWLRALRLPLRQEGEGREEVKGRKTPRPTLEIQLVTAQIQTADEQTSEPVGGIRIPADQPHPNHFTSWMIARAKEGTHWHWSTPQGSARRRTRADEEWNLEWSVEQWDVPATEGFGLETSQSREADGDEQGYHTTEEEQEGRVSPGGEVKSVDTQAVVYGIDNLD